jgi:hypothetical protein
VLPSCFVPVAVAVVVGVVVAVAVYSCSYQLPVTSCASSVVRYLALVMRLSCASSVVLLSCLPSLGFDKKKR